MKFDYTSSVLWLSVSIPFTNAMSLPTIHRQSAIVLIDPVTEWKSTVEAATKIESNVIAVQLANVKVSDRMKKFLPSSDSLLQEPGISHVLPLHDVHSCVQELKLLEQTENCIIRAVIPLSELAVEVSDIVAACLGLPHNSLELMTSRRDKGFMKQAVSLQNLKVAKFARISSADELLTMMDKLSLSLPIVVKTPQGFSTTDVYICSEVEEARSAVESILHKRGPDGRFVNQALLEEYITGTEFAINLIICSDDIIVSDIWKYEKNSRAQYGSAEICNPKNHLNLVAYAKAVAKAVGIRHGAAHVEMKSRKVQTNHEEISYVDPVLMEVGARMSGGRKASMMQALGYDPFGMLIKAHSGDPIGSNNDFIPHQFVRHLFLPVEKGGKIRVIHNFDNLSLDTLHSSTILVSVGDVVAKTTDITSCAGFVWLIGNRSEVDKDTKRILSTFKVIVE